MGEGVKPVLQGALGAFTFPFGELVVFLAVFDSLNSPKTTPEASTAASPLASQVRSLLSILAPPKTTATAPFSLPALPVGELLGGVSNTVRGLVLNDNWWVVLLIIFLFFS